MRPETLLALCRSLRDSTHEPCLTRHCRAGLQIVSSLRDSSAAEAIFGAVDGSPTPSAVLGYKALNLFPRASLGTTPQGL